MKVEQLVYVPGEHYPKSFKAFQARKQAEREAIAREEARNVYVVDEAKERVPWCNWNRSHGPIEQPSVDLKTQWLDIVICPPCVDAQLAQRKK